MKSIGENEAHMWLLEHNMLEPVEPEPYTWLLRMRKWGLMYSGGLINQPHLFMLETRAAERGEALHNQRVLANQKIKAMFSNGNQQ